MNQILVTMLHIFTQKIPIKHYLLLYVPDGCTAVSHLCISAPVQLCMCSSPLSLPVDLECHKLHPPHVHTSHVHRVKSEAGVVERWMVVREQGVWVRIMSIMRYIA